MKDKEIESYVKIVKKYRDDLSSNNVYTVVTLVGLGITGGYLLSGFTSGDISQNLISSNRIIDIINYLIGAGFTITGIKILISLIAENIGIEVSKNRIDELFTVNGLVLKDEEAKRKSV